MYVPHIITNNCKSEDSKILVPRNAYCLNFLDSKRSINFYKYYKIYDIILNKIVNVIVILYIKSIQILKAHAKCNILL